MSHSIREAETRGTQLGISSEVALFFLNVCTTRQHKENANVVFIVVICLHAVSDMQSVFY